MEENKLSAKEIAEAKAAKIKAHKASKEYKALLAKAKEVANDDANTIDEIFVCSLPESLSWKLEEVSAKALWGTDFEIVTPAKTK